MRGISPEALAELPTFRDAPVNTRESEDDSAAGFLSLLANVLHEDLTRVRRIQNLMDYRLEEIDGIHQIPSGAIKIAELLGVDEALLREMKAARQEE